MDVARVNLSHGTPDDHRAYVHSVRAAAHSARRSVAVMADLPGPKIRLGELEGGVVTLETGAQFILRPESGARGAVAESEPPPPPEEADVSAEAIDTAADDSEGAPDTANATADASAEPAPESITNDTPDVNAGEADRSAPAEVDDTTGSAMTVGATTVEAGLLGDS